MKANIIGWLMSFRKKPKGLVHAFVFYFKYFNGYLFSLCVIRFCGIDFVVWFGFRLICRIANGLSHLTLADTHKRTHRSSHSTKMDDILGIPSWSWGFRRFFFFLKICMSFFLFSFNFQIKGVFSISKRLMNEIQCFASAQVSMG